MKCKFLKIFSFFCVLPVTASESTYTPLSPLEAPPKILYTLRRAAAAAGAAAGAAGAGAAAAAALAPAAAAIGCFA